MTDDDPGATTDHALSFTTASAIGNSGRIEIIFGVAFDLASDGDGIDDADISETLQDTPTISWVRSGQKLTGTIGAGDTVSAGAQSVTVGTSDEVTNPSNAGTYLVYIITRSSSGSILDIGYGFVNIGGATTAKVTIKTYISATITDNGDAGINFGALDPNTTDSPEVDQVESGSPQGAITVVVGSEVNTTTYVYTSCTDWSDGGTETIDAATNCEFDYGNGSGAAPSGTPAAMTEYSTYTQVGSGIAAGGGSKEVYHYLTVPSGQAAGDYTSTYYYQVTATGT
jgi:hypothetical protein